MAAMAMTESLDAPMMDFSGEDIPMQTSSSTGWIHPEATMDDDYNFNPDDVEIDMDYLQEPFEYEMADDSSAEVQDIEVFDVSQVHTPALIDTVVEDATLASPAVPEHDLTDTHDRSPLDSTPTLVIQGPSPTPQPTQNEGDQGITGTEPGPNEWDQGHSEPSAAPSSPHLTEYHLSRTELANTENATEATPIWDIGVPVELQALPRQPTPTPVEQLQLESPHEEPAHDPEDQPGDDENPVPSHASSGDPHEVSDGIFIDPPPPVMLFLGGSEEEYYLFNRPTHSSPATDDRGVTDNSLFLHDFPTLYYEPLAKVFQALRSDDRLAQLFDLTRGELVIDAYDLVDLVISEDNSYTNEVSFHDLNLLHDHADLAGPLRIHVGCNPRRFITRYRELKSKLEQFNLLDEVNVDDAQLLEHYGLAESSNAHDGPDSLAQDEEGSENLTLEEDHQATTEHQTDGPAHAANRSGEGEYPNDTNPEQAQPADDEGSTVGPLSGDESTDLPVGATEDNHAQEPAVATTDSDGGHPGPAEDLDAAAVHGPSDDHTSPPGDNPNEYGDVVTSNEDYEADYNENDQDSEPGETVVIEVYATDADRETAASNLHHPQDDQEQHDDEVEGTDKDSEIIDLTAPNPDSDHITMQQDTDTDSIGQRTLDEFVDAQEETWDDSHPHEGEESNSTTDQSNELNPDPDQFGDEFDWGEDFGGHFEESGDFEDQINLETKRIDSPEPTSGKSSKRGFDEVDSDTADEETPGDVSPNSKRKKVL
ncbi:hypothetical protein BJ322DRAFT_1029261 [Thelephora terrestris]|uniref:Uncharacterized protein n=1 Tax=Thelephora terrestris TaxID=56493 RepID=A0A9P6LCL1_9AGAM|nr:hypothetical protein BJ322DRAFT_1029261 [Thelephora terrestris]